MKANELMIGDWVMQDDNLQQNRACQITGIYDNVVVDVTGEKVPIHESHIKPIPLTDSILESNGFYHERNIGYLYEDDEYKIIVELWNSNYRILYNHDVVVNIRCVHDICVHEVQHALRLCGIKKEIKL